MYQAVVFLMTENCWLNPETNCYEGCDPDSMIDHGIQQKITGDTLEDLTKKLHAQFSMKDFEVFGGHLEAQYEGEHHYNTPAKEQIPFYETYSIYIQRVEYTSVDSEDDLNNILKGVN
jgi:hypothetical protein